MVRLTLQLKPPKLKKIKEPFNEEEEQQNDVILDLEPEQSIEAGDHEAIHMFIFSGRIENFCCQLRLVSIKYVRHFSMFHTFNSPLLNSFVFSSC